MRSPASIIAVLVTTFSTICVSSLGTVVRIAAMPASATAMVAPKVSGALAMASTIIGAMIAMLMTAVPLLYSACSAASWISTAIARAPTDMPGMPLLMTSRRLPVYCVIAGPELDRLANRTVSTMFELTRSIWSLKPPTCSPKWAILSSSASGHSDPVSLKSQRSGSGRSMPMSVL